jgi:hypothetical protein
MRPFRASNQAPFGSVILMLIVAIVVGAIVGGILWAIEHFTSFYLVFAFPIFAGFIAGGALSVVIRSGKVRSPLIAGLCGIIAGVVMYGVYHYATYYVSYPEDWRQFLIDEGYTPADDTELRQIIADWQLEQYGSTGFIPYMNEAAEIGFSISRATGSSSSSGIDIQGNIAWVYWGVEILIAAAIAAFTAGKQAGEPFDEETGQWYGPVESIGRVSLKARKELNNALKNGDYNTAGRMLSTGQIKGNVLDVGVRRSPDTAAQDIILVVRQQSGRNMNEVQRGVITPFDLQQIERGIDTGNSAL